MTGAVVALLVLLAVVGPLILYSLVRSEHDDRELMGRKRAERAARRDRHVDDIGSSELEADRRQR